MKCPRLRKLFITEKQYFTKGVGEFSGIKSIISLFLLVSIWLKQREMDMSIGFVILAFIIIVFLFRMFGWIWDKAHLYHEENEFGNDRNPFVRRVREKLKIKTSKQR